MKNNIAKRLTLLDAVLCSLLVYRGVSTTFFFASQKWCHYSHSIRMVCGDLALYGPTNSCLPLSLSSEGVRHLIHPADRKASPLHT